ncbi:MAG: hypothetical protein JW866_08850 [Ignavibacteriales bacterium]|nr:hypothetical protein [Ignavibacteriales bacterium]
MKKILFLIVLSFAIFVSCDDENILQSLFTAKENVNPVLSAAASWSSDAKLAGIYGWNISTDGKVNLLSPTTNAFVYIVQSDSKGSNEFYVPVYAAGPVKSPINFTTMLGYIQDPTAKGILSTIFGALATTNINSSATYHDSPAVLTTMLARSDVSTFRSSHSGSKIDMFLLPSAAISIPGVIGNSSYADWIVHFYTDSNSLVLYYNRQFGTIIKISL